MLARQSISLALNLELLAFNWPLLLLFPQSDWAATKRKDGKAPPTRACSGGFLATLPLRSFQNEKPEAPEKEASTLFWPCNPPDRGVRQRLKAPPQLRLPKSQPPKRRQKEPSQIVPYFKELRLLEPSSSSSDVTLTPRCLRQPRIQQRTRADDYQEASRSSLLRASLH